MRKRSASRLPLVRRRVTEKVTGELVEDDPGVALRVDHELSPERVALAHGLHVQATTASQLRGVDTVSNSGLALADDCVAEVAEIAMAAS